MLLIAKEDFWSFGFEREEESYKRVICLFLVNERAVDREPHVACDVIHCLLLLPETNKKRLNITFYYLKKHV